MTDAIAKNIRAHRLARGMTQEELAAKIFSTRQTVSNYETGKSRPDYETIGRLAEALGVSAEELLYDTAGRRTKARVWRGLAITAFLWALARSLRFSPLLIKADSHIFVTYSQAYTTIIFPAFCCALGWGLVRLYELYIRKAPLHMSRHRRIIAICAALLGLWFLASAAELPKLCTAAADTARNEYGGPAMLSVYLDTFYIKYIYNPLLMLPVLNTLFSLLGGLLAAAGNGEEAA